MNITTLKALASLAIFSTSRKKTANPIIKQVIKIEFTGVKKRELTFPKNPGSILSLAMAKGNLEDAKTPEFAIESKVITPIIPAI
jgi:hypothetical protein